MNSLITYGSRVPSLALRITAAGSPLGIIVADMAPARIDLREEGVLYLTASREQSNSLAMLGPVCASGRAHPEETVRDHGQVL